MEMKSEKQRNSVNTDYSEVVARIEAIYKSLSSADTGDRKTIAWGTLKDFKYKMNNCTAEKSVFEKYPLIGAPVLIALASLIAQVNEVININMSSLSTYLMSKVSLHRILCTIH